MPEPYWHIIRTLFDATYTTIGISVGAFILAVILGFAVALARSHGPSWLRGIAAVFVETLRNIPILVQLFILYFGLAQLGLHISPMMAAVSGLGMNGAALLSEVFRSSINAVDRGQTEAGLAIGLTPSRILYHIVLIQSLRISLPSIGNFAISLMKDTSLASAVAVPELVFQARMLVSETFLSTEIYLLVGLIYFGLSFPVARYFRALEHSVTPGS